MASVSEDPISLWLKLGALDKLEQALMDGYGEQLVGKTSRIPQVAKFLKQVPTIQAQIEEIHEAIMQGRLDDVKELLSQQRKLTFCRDQQGASPLHKAVLFQQKEAVAFFVEHFPSVMHTRDHQGRTPLHYAAVLQDKGETYEMLRAAGADENATDVYGHTPDSYLESPGELTVEQLKEGATSTRAKRKGHRRNKSGDDSAPARGNSAKPAGLKVQIREIIAQGNLEALEELVLHGHGDKLLGETSQNPLVQEFLDTVPGYMEQISDVHRAVLRGRLREVQTLMNHKSLALARDSLGATPVHKAVMYGHQDIAEHLADNFPECLCAKDVDGRTALHYAGLLKDGRKMYNMLLSAGAPPTIVDYKGKSPEYYLQYPDKLSLDHIIKRNQLANATYLGNTISRLKTLAPGFQKTLVNLHEKYNLPSEQMNGNHGNVLNGNDEVQSNSSNEREEKNPPATAAVDPMKKVMLRSRAPLPPVLLPRLEVTSANIRKWIEEQDLKKLEGAVLEGYGERLAQEPSCNDNDVEQYLRQDVPCMLERIRAIHRAITDDDVSQLETQLDSADYALARDHLGMTPLHKAVILGRQDVVRLIVNKFPETINARDREGRTALHYAAASCRKNGRGQIYKILLKNGSDSRIRDNRGKSSEYYKTHHLQIPPEMAHLDQSLRTRSRNRLEPAAARSRSRQNSLTTAQLTEKMTAALQKGDVSQVQELALEGYGKHLLGRTSWNEQVRNFLKALPQFLQNVASVHEAAATGDVEKLKQLTEGEESFLKARNEHGNQPIHTAVDHGQPEVVKFILESQPASISSKAAHGRYPIHMAALRKDDDMFKLLVESGADPKVLDQKGRTAEYYARISKGGTKPAALPESVIPPPAEPKSKSDQPTSHDQPGDQDAQGSAQEEQPAASSVKENESESQGVKDSGDGSDDTKTENEKPVEGVSAVKKEDTEISSGAGESDSGDAEGKVDDRAAELHTDQGDEELYEMGNNVDENSDDLRENITQEQSDTETQEGLAETEDEDPEEQQAETCPDSSQVDTTATDADENDVEDIQVDKSNQDSSALDQTAEADAPTVDKDTPPGDGQEEQTTDHESDSQEDKTKQTEETTETQVNGDGDLHGDENDKGEENTQDADTEAPREEQGVSPEEAEEQQEGANDGTAEERTTEENVEVGEVEGSEGDDSATRGVAEVKSGPCADGDVKGPTEPESTEAFTEDACLDEGEKEQEGPDEGGAEETAREKEPQNQNEGAHEDNERKADKAEGNTGCESITASDQLADKENVEEGDDSLQVDPSISREDEPKDEVADPEVDAGSEIKGDPSEPANDTVGESSGEASDESRRSTNGAHDSEEIHSEQQHEVSADGHNDGEQNKGGELSGIIADQPNEQIRNGTEEAHDTGGAEKHEDVNNNVPESGNDKRLGSRGSHTPSIATTRMDRLNELIELWIKEGDLLRLEHVVIAGQGERLRNKTSDDKQVQEFLSLVPTYMEKIKAVHETVVRGNLNEVRQVLTRKRFALSRDQLGASPLHLAVLHGHTDVLQYIIQRFPDTLDGPDNEGRTPLHYAAVVAEGQNYFDILKAAGADDSIKDKVGNTPEYYLKHPGQLTIRDLLEGYKLLNGDDNKSATVDVWQRPPTPEAEKEVATSDEAPEPEMDTQSDSQPATQPEPQPEPQPEAQQTAVVDPAKVPEVNASAAEDVRQLVQTLISKDRSQEEGQFLMGSVGDVLIEGLLTVAKKRPEKPAEYLASWLGDRAPGKTKSPPELPTVQKEPEAPTQEDSTQQDSSSATSGGSLTNTGITEVDPEQATEEEAARYVGDHTKMKDEEGQTVLHFAASHSHREGCFYALVRQGEALLAERDARYQTARDVARDAGQQENVLTIDQYVLDAFLAQRDDFIQRLVHDGYDQVFKVADRHGRDVTTLLQQYDLKDMQTLMQDIADFQRARDELHSFVRKGFLEGVLNLVNQDAALVTAKSHRGRCALHIAVLAENCDIITALIKANPDAVHIPDNMGRTPLHYAMGLPQVTAMGQILIRNGATRTARDVKMRTPSYFFIYKQEIRKLKLEETPD